MKYNKLTVIIIAFMLTTVFSVRSFAAKLDITIPKFDANQLKLDSNGTATFIAPPYAGLYKRFDVQLLKRVMTTSTSTGVVYEYKTYGNVKHVDPADNSVEFTISSTGYYQFQIRGVNLDGDYGEWVAIYDNSTWSSQKQIYPGVPVTEDDIGAGGGGSYSSNGSTNWYDYFTGPGVINQGYPNYYQNGVIIGPNGQIYYGNNYQYQIPNQFPNQYQNGYILPGNITYNYQQVPPPFGTGTNNYQYNYNNNVTNNYGEGANIPNANSPNNNVGSVAPQISQVLEIGWHIDNNGRFYYQGNGVVLRGTWYLIDGSYYRFSDTGYLLINQWFKDNATGYWYYLGGDGKMLTGWQCINGTWYYFKPENGNGFGAMYRNTTLQISDSKWGTGIYAFDSSGASVMNAWYGGYHYGKDGKRTN